MSDHSSLQSLTIAIDIDGVVAPVGTPEVLAELHAGGAAWAAKEYLHFEKVMFGTLVAAPVRDLLREFDQHPAVHPMWHSSWRENATEELAPALGVGETWPQFATQDEYRHAAIWWKLQAVQRWLLEHADQPGAHLLWLDDDVADSIRSGEVSRALVQHPQLTIITPGVHYGLTPAHLDTIHDLMRRLP